MKICKNGHLTGFRRCPLCEPRHAIDLIKTFGPKGLDDIQRLPENRTSVRYPKKVKSESSKPTFKAWRKERREKGRAKARTAAAGTR